MLRAATSLGRSGLQDWLLQRVSALILAIYVLFLIVFLVLHPISDQLAWYNLFSKNTVKLFTFLALLSLLIHAWIGIWTVSTDYIKTTALRLSFQLLMAITLFCYFMIGTQILWR